MQKSMVCMGERMRKADREEFYRLIDEMKYLIDTNKILSKKDVHFIINELITLKLRVKEKNKAFR